MARIGRPPQDPRPCEAAGSFEGPCPNNGRTHVRVGAGAKVWCCSKHRARWERTASFEPPGVLRRLGGDAAKAGRRFLKAGGTYRELADILGVSVNTVRNAFGPKRPRKRRA